MGVSASAKTVSLADDVDPDSRLSTSRLHQDPAQIALANEDKFAKYDYTLVYLFDD